MAMVVKNNMSAVRTLNTLNGNTNALQKSLQKVSSGMKINSAQDDASGYAISERMRVRIRSLDQANQNTQNDASLMKTAEGAVGNTVEILRALKEKAINAANDSNTDEDRQTIQKEINQFIDQIDDNALVQFNGKYLIDGSKNNATVSSKTILLNQSLHTSTLEGTELTNLYNRAGDSLGIQTSDKWQVSWVENGNITFKSGTVGENTIESILSTAWGNFGQVAATTDKGLISSATPVKSYTQIEGTIGDGVDGNISDEIKAAIKAAVEKLGDDVPDAGATESDPKVYKLSDLGFFADKNGSPLSSDATVSIWPDPTDNTAPFYKIEGLDEAASLYVEKTESTGINLVESDKSITSDLSAAIDADKKTDNFASDEFGAELVGTGKLDTAFDEDAGYSNNTTIVTSMKLSEVEVEVNGENVPKYYLSADGKTSADDIIVTRTTTYSGSNHDVGADTIKFTSASGADLSGYTLYEVSDAQSGTGFTDAWDKFGKAVYTPDKTPGVAVASTGDGGVNGQLSGLTISILDQDGNVKKAANAALDQFKQYQRAENMTGDMSLNFHIGSEANVAIKVGMSDMRSEALGLKGSDGTRIDVFTKEHANAAINVIENALTKALDQQTTIGAIEARLEYTSTNLTTSSENVQAAESTIRDADMAKEMTNYTKSNVLLQAAQAMLAQANQNSSAVLSLLQ